MSECKFKKDFECPTLTAVDAENSRLLSRLLSRMSTLFHEHAVAVEHAKKLQKEVDNATGLMGRLLLERQALEEELDAIKRKPDMLSVSAEPYGQPRPSIHEAVVNVLQEEHDWCDNCPVETCCHRDNPPVNGPRCAATIRSWYCKQKENSHDQS